MNIISGVSHAAHGDASNEHEELLFLEEASSIVVTSTTTTCSDSSSKYKMKMNTKQLVVTAAVMMVVLSVACISAAVAVVTSTASKNTTLVFLNHDNEPSTTTTTTTATMTRAMTSDRELLVDSSFVVLPVVEDKKEEDHVDNVIVVNSTATSLSSSNIVHLDMTMLGTNNNFTYADQQQPIMLGDYDANANADVATNVTAADDYTTTSIDSSILLAATSSPTSSKPTTKLPTPKPSTRPPTPKPVKTLSPTRYPTRIPTLAPTLMKPFVRGDLAITVASLGIKICTGMSVRLIGKAGQKVLYANGQTSSNTFHKYPDGAGIIPVVSTGGYVYVSNSEGDSGTGGVYGLYFDSAGSITNYTKFLGGTTWNCGGGKTPWNTWVSCEEHSAGQCWQIDPNPAQPKATKTVVGGAGGYFESFAVDNRVPTKPIFFVTEDASNGALRKYTPPASSTTSGGNFNALHTTGGTYEYLIIVNTTHFTWSTSLAAGRTSQKSYFSYSEGIDFHNGYLYFVSKTLYKMFILNLDTKTYTTMSTQFGSLGTGGGAFNHQPDQIIHNGGDYLYLTEDGGVSPGIYALHKPTGAKYAIVQGYSSALQYDETSGLAFSPDGKKMYAAFQDCGCLLEFSRDDGLSFDGDTLDVKFHTPTQVFRRH